MLADSLQLDHDACGNLDSMIVPCCGELRELKGGHYHKIVEITENAGKCLLSEYAVRISKYHLNIGKKLPLLLHLIGCGEAGVTTVCIHFSLSFWEVKKKEMKTFTSKNLLNPILDNLLSFSTK